LDEGEKARKSIKEHISKKRGKKDEILISAELPEHPRQLVIHAHTHTHTHTMQHIHYITYRSAVFLT
jgi:hypothetical protein